MVLLILASCKYYLHKMQFYINKIRRTKQEKLLLTYVCDIYNVHRFVYTSPHQPRVVKFLISTKRLPFCQHTHQSVGLFCSTSN